MNTLTSRISSIFRSCVSGCTHAVSLIHRTIPAPGLDSITRSILTLEMLVFQSNFEITQEWPKCGYESIFFSEETFVNLTLPQSVQLLFSLNMLKAKVMNVQEIDPLLPLQIDEFIQKLNASDTLMSPINEIWSEPGDNLRTFINSILSLANLKTSDKWQIIGHFITIHAIPVKNFALSAQEQKLLIPHLRYLDLRDLTDDQVQKFLKCPRINYLLINNDATTFLPKLPFCLSLNCHSCTALRELPPLPMCQMLNCSSCPSLHRISALPVCRVVNCARCNVLYSLPIALPLCEEFDSGYCSNLLMLPQLPKSANVHFNGCPILVIDQLNIDVEVLKKLPKEYLFQLGSLYLLRDKTLPKSIIFLMEVRTPAMT